FAALGLLRGKQPADPAARDAGIRGAIERFQEVNDIPPDGSMSRGGRTILHLNKALDPRRRTRPITNAPAGLSPVVRSQRPSLIDSFLRMGNAAREHWQAPLHSEPPAVRSTTLLAQFLKELQSHGEVIPAQLVRPVFPPVGEPPLPFRPVPRRGPIEPT